MIEAIQKPVRIGMVGGGPGSNIGETHRRALRLDGNYRLVAGSFSRNIEANLAIAEVNAGIRTYASYLEMAAVETNLEDGIEAVLIASPDDTHFEIAKHFLQLGVHVICEKPLTLSSVESMDLIEIAETNKAILAVAHAYSAYPMVREARAIVASGELGKVRFVDVQHASGWAAEKLEDLGNPTVVWRMTSEEENFPSIAYDLGTHALQLARFISGEEVDELSARFATWVPGRQVFDNLQMQLRFLSGAEGRLWASMAATGNHHGLEIKVYGSRASLEWSHENSQFLIMRGLSGEQKIISQGAQNTTDDSKRLIRYGLGHPEGFIEAFSNLYGDIADAIVASRQERGVVQALPRHFPDGRDGLVGVLMVEAAVRSNSSGGAWVPLEG